jgi:hypothetical protein
LGGGETPPIPAAGTATPLQIFLEHSYTCSGDPTRLRKLRLFFVIVTLVPMPLVRRNGFPPRRALLALCLAWSFCALSAEPNRHEPPVNFSREILPILSDNCFYCHGPDPNRRKAKLRLDEETNAKKTRDDGTTPILPGKSDRSELIKRITSDDPEEMMPPPKSNKTLTSAQKETLRRWIDEGAGWGIHWAFSELKRPVVPSGLGKKSRMENPIDAFVRARLRREKLQMNPKATRAELIRRVTLDLTGLPPTSAEVNAFLKDKSSRAYETLVDRLLASTAFGERMAWDWMEVARYADSNGYQGDSERTMWPWRDWVVKAFNDNMPYDQFTIWQLAGDLLPNATLEQKVATGFCRNHPINGEGGRIPEENRVDYVMDMAETTGTAWLALTFNCTRCHDHKFDPLTARDYYSLSAYFNQTPVDGSGGDPQAAPVVEILSDSEKAKRAELNDRFNEAAKETARLEGEAGLRTDVTESTDPERTAKYSEAVTKALRKKATDRSRDELEALRKQFESESPEFAKALMAQLAARDKRDEFNRQIVRVMVMQDMPKPRQTFLLKRGLYNSPGEEVSPATPAKLPHPDGASATNRLGLARWIVSAENPLSARVTVNRFWQMFFGIGIVKTAEDFGVQGEFPKHPELLDWLAADFRDGGWNVKRLIRQIVTSETYQQSSRANSEQFERDPENRLLARGPRYRLPSWMLRDQALAVSGLLVNKAGGPPVKSYQPSGVWEEATFGQKRYEPDHGDALYRRSLYIFWRRIIGPTLFFDTPSRSVCTVKPMRTNTPLQALTTLNDVTYVEAARALAEKILNGIARDEERLDALFRRVLGRPISEKERKILSEGVARGRRQFADDRESALKLLAVGESKRDEKLDVAEHAAWTSVCLTVLNLDETLTKE